MHIFLPLNCFSVINIRLLTFKFLFQLHVFFKLQLVDQYVQIF